MGFKDDLWVFSDIVNQLQIADYKEHISDEDAIAAINILNFIKYQKVPDIFLGCAAYNLLSTYVKQSECKFGFQFRRHILNLLKGIEDIHQLKSIAISYDNSEKLGLLIISFWGFQFSFQCQKFTEQVKRLALNNHFVWDGIRKQKCATSIFNFALCSSWITNMTLGGADLRELIKEEQLEYAKGGYTFLEGRVIKTQNLRPASHDMDAYLKNYIRQKLCECQDRPVIISGIFERVWEKHLTFTSVKPYIAHTRVVTICDHINLYRPDVEKVLDISTLKHGKRYYIIGYCEPYKHADRMGVQLATDQKFVPIFGINEFKDLPSDFLSESHRFSIEEYLSEKQKWLKL